MHAITLIVIVLVIQTQALFYNDTDVNMLKEKHFATRVLNVNHMTLLTLYVPWCLKCMPPYPQMFKRYARSIRSWKSVVRVASINCENSKVCRHLGVGDMPVITVVPPLTKKINRAVNVTLPNNVEEFKDFMVAMIMNDTHLSNRKLLQSIWVKDKEELCELLEDDDDLDDDVAVYILLERNPTLASARVSLNLNKKKEINFANQS